MKICRICGRGEPLARFPFIKATGRYRSRCQECENLRARTKYAEKIESGRIELRKPLESRPLYYIWTGMIQRTTNQKFRDYHLYGGRGISVCELWRNSYEAFAEYMGERPSLQHSIDRIDNDGNYEPGNVQWTTVKNQANNRRSNKFLTSNQETKTIAEWSAATGIRAHTIRVRMKLNWPVGEILTQPTRIYKSREAK